MSKKNSYLTEAEWYAASWNYFSLLSGQRMQMLQFFISLEVFLSGAFITLISLNTRLQRAEIIVSFLIFLMAVVFRGLDHRTKTMIHICEEAMETIEKGDGVDDRFNPISSVNAMKTKLTYTKWICFLQIIFAFAGLSGAILVLLDII